MPRKSVQSLITFPICLACFGTVHAATFSVDTLNDSGAGTLRAAIVSANANQGPDTIKFNAGLNGTIVLSSDLPQLTGDVDITGPGAEIITISGQSLYRPFFVSSGSTVTLTGLTIANGQSSLIGSGGTGGGIHNEGDLTVTDCVLSNNHAEFDGGAIRNVGGSLVVSQSTLSGNTVDESGVGAGISNAGAGTVSIIESTFTANTGAYYGGAVDNEGTVTIARSTLSSNGALIGGAVANVGTLSIRNSTLSGNDATEEGGGIDNFLGEANVEFSTLTENSAVSGGGVNNAACFSIKHSLVANSAAGGSCGDAGGTLLALGVNFATDPSCAGFFQSTAGEINLGALADNGGPTQTHALLSGSVAIDVALDCTLSDSAGSLCETIFLDGFEVATPVTQDQRGQSRPAGAECDSGAFESE